MTIKYFSCHLLSDVVLNNKLATEGNMTSLNYIPGSNFLGIAASKLYKSLKPEESYEMFHSGKISFGDALPYINHKQSYSMPFAIMMQKGKEKLGQHTVYLHHQAEVNIQLQQQRTGFLFADGGFIKHIGKNFALKSAQDALERKSKDGSMFGFESIKKGQTFVFSITGVNTNLLNKAEEFLLGPQRVGKSKSAEFGQVYIEKLTSEPTQITSMDPQTNTLVYATSNLCFMDKFGQPSFRPTPEQLGISNGKIIWEKSQIRTYSYSPWNGQRNATDPQRDCIAMGSVFYIDAPNKQTTYQTGAYQAEGLGKLLYNPAFLFGKADDPPGTTSFFKAEENEGNHVAQKPEVTALAKYLVSKKEKKQADLKLSKSLLEALNTAKSKQLTNISPSQWGGIRAMASKQNDIERLQTQLFSKETGYLCNGVAYEKYWGKSKDQMLKAFKDIYFTHKEYGTGFIVKFASEMAKASKNKSN